MIKVIFFNSRKHLFLALLFVGLIFQACTKKPGQIGESIQPDQDLLNLRYTDSISISAYSIREDSVRTDEPERVLLGSMKDPVFGTTQAGFYTQFRLSSNNHSFGENPQLDSLVLQLSYNGYYGDTTQLQTVRVYELSEQLQYDSAYYSTRRLQTSATDLANYSFNIRPNSPFVFDGDTLSPAVRIRLSDVSPDLGNKLLNASEENLASDTAFKMFFNGLYLIADPIASGGALAMFNLPVNMSRMTIYYSNNEQDSLRYEYFITTAEARFNTFDHFDYADADPQFVSQVISGDTLLGEQQLYLQGTGGVKTRIKFPDLNFLEQESGAKVVINEAKLVITGLNYDTTTYFAPVKLALVRVNDDETYSILADQLDGDAYFGGDYVAGSNGYQFRLTRYVQEMVKGGESFENDGLQLSVQGASARPNRMVIGGIQPASEEQTPIKLIIHYTLVSD